MPELPEVQRVRQSIARHIVGQRVMGVVIYRQDIITGQCTPKALLQHQTICDIQRHGKQLAILTSPTKANDSASADSPDSASSTAPSICVHLGMTGSLRYHPPAATSSSESTNTPTSVPDIASIAAAKSASGPATDAADPAHPIHQKHVHIVWKLQDGGYLTFRDPRRFGGLWTFPNFHTLQTQRWARLGHDALTITPKQLHARLAKTKRPIKAALLDQLIVAGLGNIYVDEALFAVRLHPLTPGASISLKAAQGLVRAFKAILKRAIASGGSTIRNYEDGDGQAGSFQNTLKVYGRGGLPCVLCKRPLTSQTVIGRTTTLCQYCQGGL